MIKHYLCVLKNWFNYQVNFLIIKYYIYRLKIWFNLKSFVCMLKPVFNPSILSFFVKNPLIGLIYYVIIGLLEGCVMIYRLEKVQL